MSTGARRTNQGNENQSGGGNIFNKGPTQHRLHQPSAFQAKSGQSDNQTTFRGKGRT
jgi:hypothetical protein